MSMGQTDRRTNGSQAAKLPSTSFFVLCLRERTKRPDNYIIDDDDDDTTLRVSILNISVLSGAFHATRAFAIIGSLLLFAGVSLAGFAAMKNVNKFKKLGGALVFTGEHLWVEWYRPVIAETRVISFPVQVLVERLVDGAESVGSQRVEVGSDEHDAEHVGVEGLVRRLVGTVVIHRVDDDVVKKRLQQLLVDLVALHDALQRSPGPGSCRRFLCVAQYDPVHALGDPTMGLFHCKKNVRRNRERVRHNQGSRSATVFTCGEAAAGVTPGGGGNQRAAAPVSSFHVGVSAMATGLTSRKKGKNCLHTRTKK
uniref:Uncharacterized protein n=1 Tax=Branchiostoma floridae TaxID=7739 RepID=C3Z151_BRAFL|eukprot:XP_002597738.1 hypothetical protein BRAFLDRAFT_77359 [Branchiostoma floridae]